MDAIDLDNILNISEEAKNQLFERNFSPVGQDLVLIMGNAGVGKSTFICSLVSPMETRCLLFNKNKYSSREEFVHPRNHILAGNGLKFEP
jgi:ABC-type lipoprotein export system ATPase subunit